MRAPGRRWPASFGLAVATALAVVAAGLGCSEDLVAPGNCPGLCPSSGVRMADTTLAGIVTQDSTYVGYVAVSEADFVVLSDTDSQRAIALVRFGARDSTWTPSGSDTAVGIGRVDSVTARVYVLRRDTSVHDVRVLLYRMPVGFDSGMGYVAAQQYLADSLLVDSLPVPDSVASGAVTVRLRAGVLDTIPATDSGVVALALAVRASQRTSVSIASSDNDTVTGFRLDWYVHARAPADTLAKTLSASPSYDGFASEAGSLPAGALRAGGMPASRSILRLSLPDWATDSVGLVRATLILTPIRPVGGRPLEEFRLSARGVVRDFGAKSLVYSDTSAGGTVPLTAGDSGEVHIDVVRLLREWGSAAGDSLPRALMLLVEPEASGMGEVVFAPASAGAAAPRLRVTHVIPYVFGVP